MAAAVIEGRPTAEEERKMLLEERYRDLSSDKRRLHKSLDRKRKKESARGKKSMPPPRAFSS